VTGGIACYKSVSLARLLTQAGAEVDVVMTHGAREFVGAVTFESVTGRRVWGEIFEPGEALAHIRLARAADAVVVAPVTADFLARAAHGRSDDLLAAVLLATTSPVLLVPAMNDRMWAHPATRSNASRARELGYRVLDPDVGPLAFGEGEGAGRMPEPETIVAEVERLFAGASALAGKHILVTAGATREPIDPVRFISNHSTGRMGVALAREAARRGADVTLVAGAMEVAPPPGVRTIRVHTVAELADAVARELPAADALVMAAAPADFRPARVALGKIRKSSAPAAIELAPTADVLRETRAHRKPGAVIVGFALETDAMLESARGKLRDKALDLVVANRAGVEGEGFGSDTNRVTIVSATGEEALPLMSKDAAAAAILDRVERVMTERGDGR
jgi:phosphopantothenoylcysteine decarboxylase/phosphopantothenate--cysteine ligase